MYIVYSKPNCPQCVQAVDLLKSKGLSYKKINIDIGQERIPTENYTTVNELRMLLPLAKSVPQIFKDGVHVGGLSDLRKSL